MLSSVFTQTDISYAMEGNNIMLMRKNTSVTQQSNRRITGVVKDAIGEPIIGANIVVKGTTNGIITDIKRKFQPYGLRERHLANFLYRISDTRNPDQRADEHPNYHEG